MSTRQLSGEFTRFIKDDPGKDQYYSFQAETDHEKIVSSLSIVSRLYLDQVLMLCNRSHPKLQYVGSNSADLLGFTSAEMIAMTVSDFFNRVHPEDQQALQQCFEFINNSEPYDPLSHRFVLYYRFRNKVGQYVYLRDEKLAIKTDCGKYIYFTMFKNLSNQEKFFQVKLEIYQYQKGHTLKVYTYNPRSNDQAITPRQHEIIQLIVQGFSTQEIADRLHVSVNTIKNHKQLLFKKVNVKSSIELVNFASRNGG